MTNPLLRCAIYTRKSTEEGLEQEFNSLHAQREACASYIKSQVGLGWKLIAKHYDDGGVSGGTMDRPALQELLEDIKGTRVDVVVVYKIDRLTRSLMDFARIVEVFDQHKVSFVSVTQQFNTTTSMGRLTLNVLLSFAQFEREVTSERIRDKIAASKQKGMWMGGLVPMGYRVENRRLLVEPTDAHLVRQLFDLYLEIGSGPLLKERGDELGWVTPRRKTPSGLIGGKPFSLGHLYWILSNPIYAGIIQHHGKSWPGLHEAIIAADVWDAVQQKLADNKAAAKNRTGHTSLLTGLLFDETGDRLSPSHSKKADRRYRYYVSRRLARGRRKDDSAWRLPARELENAVLAFLTDLLRDQQKLTKLVGMREPHILRQALDRAAGLSASRLDLVSRKRNFVGTVLPKITIAPHKLELSLSHAGLCEVLGLLPDKTVERRVPFELPFTLRRRRAESKLVFAGHLQQSAVDTRLIQIVARAHEWMDRIVTGQTVAEVAREVGVDDGEISRALPLAFLAPEIIARIVSGKQPAELVTRRILRASLPSSWAEQGKVLRFTSSLPSEMAAAAAASQIGFPAA